MFKVITSSMILVSFVLSMALSACSPQDTTTSFSPMATTSPAPASAISSTGEATGLDGLGLTETQIMMLEQTGIVNLDSVDIASKIAGFHVAVPAYVPEGYKAGKFMVSVSGGGLPQGTMKFNDTQVQQFYTWPENRQLSIILIQAAHEFGIGGGEPFEICGVTGERKLSEADPANGQEYARLSFGWEKDGIWYALTGMLTDNIDEEEMKKIACSIGTK